MLNKSDIGTNPPSDYIGRFKSENSNISESLESHLIELDGFGIENNDYDAFLKARAKRIFDALKEKIDI